MYGHGLGALLEPRALMYPTKTPTPAERPKKLVRAITSAQPLMITSYPIRNAAKGSKMSR